ncbi:strigolactone esterase D14 [Ricinus communis]|uniref:Sigma factor sigb regulation protein rsbq, putative n=1 Tax=Ricinus communis TaxID=3988 RepID=B9T016_RICCO|nr:strigolactone esterase D14 [Ricinus communis]EEF30788.1 sigma factor sigb regulation protein rsbq, putative [Ricinus communis]|eukprot:XP_002531585.1 strigolactone esterase D14 [Ricinus communis]
MDVLYNHGGGVAEALNAKVYGNGTETLVLAHGFGSDQNVWQFLIPYLACCFKIVVFDLVFSPNVNSSLYDPIKYSNLTGYARDLLSLLDELNVNKTIYLGHSMSAMIGCTAALQRPHLFQHLVLLGGSPRYLNAEGYHGGFERSDVKAILRSMNHNFSSWVQGFAPVAVGMNNTEAITIFANSLGRMKPSIAHSVAKTVFLSDLRRILPQVSVPCTIIQSKKDIIVPEFVAHYMKKKLGGYAKVKILKTEGHFPHLTAYPLLLKALKKVGTNSGTRTLA